MERFHCLQVTEKIQNCLLTPQNQDSHGIVGDTQGAQDVSDLCTEGKAEQDLPTAGSAPALVSGSWPL